MKHRFSKKDKLILGVAALLLVLLIVYAQFFSLSPLKSDLGLKQQSLTSEQKLLDIVSQKKAEDTKKTMVKDTRELQKILPVKPLQEQLILDLEKAETLSNSKISSMGFSKDADANTTADQTNAENTNGQQQPAGNQDTANQAATNQGTTNQEATAGQPAQPVALKKLIVSLSVESPTYKGFEKFIETLESLKRIVVVESISYAGGQEITSLDQEVQPLSYSLTISAFYMPSLTDLTAHLPTIDAPAPTGKDNPLSEFPSTGQTQP